jgi:biotin carboxylase
MPTSFPVVVKPRFGSGSRAVRVCTTAEDFANHLAEILPCEEDMLIEECLPGVEYGIDAAVIDGRLHLILLREKLLTPLPHRQAIGYLVAPPSETLLYQQAEEMMQKVCQCLQFTTCLLHADVMWDGESFSVIEVSARPSGHHLHDLFTPVATGVDPVREFLHVACPQLGPYSFEPHEIRSLLMGFFSFEGCSIVQTPDQESIRQKYPLLAYEENCSGRFMDAVTNGPGLLNRGFFILEAPTRDKLLSLRSDLLSEFVCEVGKS